MGTVVGSIEECREMFEGSVQTRTTPFSSTTQIGNHVAYKLVRVAGDGRLVPATDEEILEVNENDMQILSATGQTVGYIPVEGLASELPRLESPEGLLQPDDMEAYTDHYNEEILQKIKEEERLNMMEESQTPSTLLDTNIQCFNENNLFDDQSLHETLLQEPIPSSSNVESESNVDQSNKVEICSNSAASPKDTALSTASGKPDFSRVRGEICLENLPIKALQETFRATFGRETNVKDKVWLKRRIAMGLINSSDVPTTIPTIKDNKLFESREKSNGVTNVVGEGMGDGVRATNPGAEPSSPDHINGHSDAPGRSSSDHFGDQYCRTDDFSSEHNRAAKRVRKPTRRYIEELSETDEKQQNDKPTIPSKGQMLSEKSEVRSSSISSGRRVVTRMVSLAGTRIQVPYVCHVRKSRPRENVTALMGCHSSCLDVKSSPAGSNLSLTPSQFNVEVMNQVPEVNSASVAVQKELFVTCHQNDKEHILTEVDQDMEQDHIDSSGNSSDDNHVSLPITQGALRRKHHRAWTLSEVTKLLDGVSMFGVGKWSEIRKLSFSSYSYRTSVDLKDKWRNLLKASASQSPSNSMGHLKKHGSMHIPMQILIRVRELAEKQSLVPPVVNKVAEDDNNRASE